MNLTPVFIRIDISLKEGGATFPVLLNVDHIALVVSDPRGAIIKFKQVIEPYGHTVYYRGDADDLTRSISALIIAVPLP